MNEHESFSIKTDRCPVGESKCEYLDEVAKLRKEVEVLSTLVRTDSLTGLFNFGHFAQALELEMERTRRSGQPTVLIMMDLDHFKMINDTWGHEVGNKILINTASIIRRTVRKLDIPCRYGGEEFAIILPDTPFPAGIQFAQRLRAMIATAVVQVEEESIKATCSFGVDAFTTKNKGDQKKFIAQVDSFLYESKEKGRDQVRHGITDYAEERVSSEEKDALLGMFDEDGDS